MRYEIVFCWRTIVRWVQIVAPKQFEYTSLEIVLECCEYMNKFSHIIF